jgi:hypothetical protein
VQQCLDHLGIASAEERIVDVGKRAARDGRGEELRSIPSRIRPRSEQPADDVSAAVANRHQQRREATRCGTVDVGARGDQRVDGPELAFVDGVQERRPVIACGVDAVDIVAGRDQRGNLGRRADARVARGVNWGPALVVQPSAAESMQVTTRA